jgi:hypothetical protein
VLDYYDTTDEIAGITEKHRVLRALASVNRQLSELAIDKMWWSAYPWDLARLMQSHMWAERITDKLGEEMSMDEYQKISIDDKKGAKPRRTIVSTRVSWMRPTSSN